MEWTQYRYLRWAFYTGKVSALSGNEAKVLMAIATHCISTDTCTASRKTIAQIAGIPYRHLYLYVASLTKKGLISKRRFPGESSSRYRLEVTDDFGTLPLFDMDQEDAESSPRIGRKAPQKLGAVAQELGASSPISGQNKPNFWGREEDIRSKKKDRDISFPDSILESIYQLYPKRVAKAAAKKAIKAALNRLSKRTDIADPVAWLSDQVRAYASARAGADHQYTPHPATWFNQDRFEDDPSDWKRKAGSNGNGIGRIPSSEANQLRDSKLVEQARQRNREIKEMLARQRAAEQATGSEPTPGVE